MKYELRSVNCEIITYHWLIPQIFYHEMLMHSLPFIFFMKDVKNHLTLAIIILKPVFVIVLKYEKVDFVVWQCVKLCGKLPNNADPIRLQTQTLEEQSDQGLQCLLRTNFRVMVFKAYCDISHLCFTFQDSVHVSFSNPCCMLNFNNIFIPGTKENLFIHVIT